METVSDKKAAKRSERFFSWCKKRQSGLRRSKTLEDFHLHTGSNIYLICLFFYYCHSFINNTMFTDSQVFKYTRFMIVTPLLDTYGYGLYIVINIVNSLLFWSPVILMFYKTFVFDVDSRWDVVRFVIPETILGIIMFLTCYNSGFVHVAMLYVFIVGARNVDFRRIAKMIIITGVTLLIISTVFSQLGIVEDLVYTVGSPRPRHSFGIGYPTDYAAYWFFLAILYFWYRKGRLKIHEGVILIAIAAYVFYFCGAKTDTACIIGIVIFSVILTLDKKMKLSRGIANISAWAMPVLSVITFLLVLTYTKEGLGSLLSENFNTLDSRFRIGNKVLMKYGVTIFGNRVPMWGFGGNTELVSDDDYTFVDISYVRILIRFGIPALLIVLLCTTYFILKRIKKNDYATPMAFLLIALNCVIAHHLLDFSYNILLLILLSDLTLYDKPELLPMRKLKVFDGISRKSKNRNKKI